MDEELANLMGGTAHKLSFASRPPTVVMLAGLNGHGKTTTAGGSWRCSCASLGRTRIWSHATRTGRPPSTSCSRSGELSVPVYTEGTGPKPEEIAERGIKEARDGGYDFVIVDTAGRQVVDMEMMEEIRRVRKASKPHSVLLVLDVVTGQNAVEVAQAFQEYADFDGMVLTKLDGDARGGAALSVVSVTGRPVKFASRARRWASSTTSTRQDGGTHPGDGRRAHAHREGRAADGPDRGRGPGQEAHERQVHLRGLPADADDQEDGPLSGLLGMIPGLGKQLKDVEIDDRQLGRVEAMITSMTVKERRNPKLLQNPSRARRIARGSGATQQDVQKLVKQFKEMQKMMPRWARAAGCRAFPACRAGGRVEFERRCYGGKDKAGEARLQGQSLLQDSGGRFAQPARRQVYRADRDLRPAAGAFDIKVDEEKARSGSARGAADGTGAQPAEDLRGPLTGMAQLENLLLVLARSLVDEPDKVEVSGTETDSRVDLELRVAPDDMGRVIGRQGRTIRAIRTVVKAASVKLGKRVTVEVPDGRAARAGGVGKSPYTLGVLWS